MALSQVAICNMALSRVGSTAFIASLTENTPEGEICALWYPHRRDELLELAPWPWATRLVELALVEGYDDIVDEVWEYVYAVPADCRKALDLWSGSRVLAPSTRLPYEVRWDATLQRKILCCDEEDASLSYVAQVDDPNQYPLKFVEALVWGLAKDLALALVGKPELAAQAHAQAELARLRCIAEAASLGAPDQPATSEFERSRA